MTSRRLTLFFIDLLLCLLFPWRAFRHRTLFDLSPRRVLVCRPDHIGDLYLSLPALRAIRAHYPDAHIAILAASWAAPLLAETGTHDQIIICDPPWWSKSRRSRFGGAVQTQSWRKLWHCMRLLRKQKFDLCIELRGDVRQILAFGVFSGAKRLLTRRRNGGAILADCAPSIDDTQNECDQNLELLRTLGIDVETPVFPSPYTPDDLAATRQLLYHHATDAPGPVVLIHPGAKWVNRWPAENYASLIQSLSEADSTMRFLLTGAASESVLCEEIARAAPERTQVLAGKLGLRQMAACMAVADLVIMADTGPMHFLNAVRSKAILLFGPTAPARFAPRSADIRIIAADRCCNTRLHETCTLVPAGCASACMESISVETALSQVHAALQKTGNRESNDQQAQDASGLLGQ